MLQRSILSVTALAALVNQAVAAVDCNANITVNAVSELEEVRKECEVIGGSLELGTNVTGHASLDGIRSITGDLSLFSCNSVEYMNYDDCPLESYGTVTLSSLSLEEIGGSLVMGHTVDKILFPKLKMVGDEVDLSFINRLTELDVSNLEEAKKLMLREAPKLETLNITGLVSIQSFYIHNATDLKSIISNGIQDLIRGSDGGFDPWDPWDQENDITIMDCPKLEEVGNLFAGSVTAHSGKELSLHAGAGLYGMLNLTDITLAWTGFSSIDLRGVHNSVRLGNGDTDSFYAEKAIARAGTRFHRAEGLTNVSFGRLVLEVYEDDLETLQLPYDSVRELGIFTHKDMVVEKMSLPDRVQDWGLKNLTLNMTQSKFLTRDEDDDDKIIWHWPEDMEHVRLEGRIEQDLLDLFIEDDLRVSGNFSVTSTSGGIDCKKVREEMKSRVGGDLECKSRDDGYKDKGQDKGGERDENEEDAAGVLNSRLLHVLGISMAVGMFLWG
ncbi:hypothetical protein CC79DRAFT_1396858 [Sarocladium strictum]